MLEIGVKIRDDNAVVVYSDYELEQFRKYLENSDNYIKLTWYELTSNINGQKPPFLKSKPKTGYFRKETIQFFGEVEKGRFQI
jgi:hypothetical protein